MADRGDTHYSTPTLNLWFLVSSLALLLVSVWMMIADWNRPWKQYQREFKRLDHAKTQAALAAAEDEAARKNESELRAGVERANADVARRQGDLDAIETEIAALKAQLYVEEQKAKHAKADFDWTRYLVEEHRIETGDPTAEQSKLVAAQDLVNETAFVVEQTKTKLRQAETKAGELTAGVAEAEKRLVSGTRDLEMLRKRLEQLAPSDKAVVAANVIRDAPGLDFIGPTLKVQKTVLDDLTFELNFTKKKRVDMCTTCHVAADRPGFEAPEDAEPLRTHPRPDLYLTSKSPHPLKDVGCTICHRGAGEALEFVRADHRPSDEAEAERWAAEHHWHKQHHWDYPMLATEFVEASCVQCHKTSMELIAEEAPKVTEGYRLFERYGCYSCHKVDWFPTSRKPGPSLKNVLAKVADPKWLDSWIADPKAFRPTTWMPQVFHLENFAPDEVIAISKYGAGPAVKGQQWNETAVAAVAAFLADRHPKQELAPPPVEGEAGRGREVFRVSGCLACHNLAPWEAPAEGAPEVDDPALVRSGENEHGPNLRGVATKLDPTWLYWWIKDPAKYWPQTRMPNLRLSDQDAADVVAYMTEDPDGVFRDVPEGWQVAASPVDVAALQEQARWFFSKLGRAEVERRLEGQNPAFPWNDAERLKVAVGEQLVVHQGCYTCHEIAGMEEMMPIGTELSNWGSKTVDKLDFGFAYAPPGSEREKLGDLPVLDHHYREGWLMRKLHRPRSYDLEKVKNPKEKLRMPWFDFSEREVRAISTFVLGLVDDEVQRAKMAPNAAQTSVDHGKRAIRQKNCTACHVAEPGVVAFEDEDGVLREVAAELVPLEYEVLPPPMDGIEELKAWLARYEEQNEEEVEELGFRLLRAEPDVGLPGESVFVEKAKLKAVRPPLGGDFVRTVTDYYYHGAKRVDPEATDPEEAVVSATADPDGEGKVQDVDGVFRAYGEEPYDKVRWTFAPPVLIDEGAKLQRGWFYAFLKDPMPLREQMRVRMPTFHYDDGEAGAIADSFANTANARWPARYARTLRTVLGLELKEKFAGEPRRWPEVVAWKEGWEPFAADVVARGAGIEVATVLGIEAGEQPAIESGFAKLLAWGTAQGFSMGAPVDPEHERVERRAPSWLASRGSQLNGSGDPVVVGHQVAVQGVNCYQCHFHDGLPPDQKEAPISWGPDLARVRERLRETWVHDWVWDPSRIYPGTSMPANFLADPPQYQQVFPNSSNSDQVQVVLDWLYNLDRDRTAATQ